MATSPEKLTELLDYCLDFASQMLRQAGEFYPFGGTLGKDGAVGAVGGSDGSDHPAPRDIYRILSEAFATSAESGEVLAVALAANVDVPKAFASPYPDAIRVHIESEGYARLIYIPYAIRTSGFFKKKRDLSLGELFAVEISPAFFRSGADV